jgi:hypothetical protein
MEGERIKKNQQIIIPVSENIVDKTIAPSFFKTLIFVEKRRFMSKKHYEFVLNI